MEMIWSALPTTVTKLVLDVGYPIKLDADDSNRLIYLNQESMKPLINYTKLKELRIFGMRDTYQSTIWETVYRNEAEEGSMRVLELQMAAPPLVRHEGWSQATDVQGLRVESEEACPYKYVTIERTKELVFDEEYSTPIPAAVNRPSLTPITRLTGRLTTSKPGGWLFLNEHWPLRTRRVS
jgi:hypothetical protein